MEKDKPKRVVPQLVQPMAFLRLGGELDQVDPIKLLQAVGKVELSVFRKLRKFLIYLQQPWFTIHTIYNLQSTWDNPGSLFFSTRHSERGKSNQTTC